MAQLQDIPAEALQQLIIALQLPSEDITVGKAAIIKYLLNHNCSQHHIAGWVKVNQGRISEIKTGKRFADVMPGSINI